MAGRSARNRRWPVSSLPLWVALALCAAGSGSGRAEPAIAPPPLASDCPHCQPYLLAAGAVIAIQGIGLIVLLGRVRHRSGRHRRGRHRRVEIAQPPQSDLLHLSRLALVGELTAAIAHEINQPLGAILSNADAAEMLLASGTTDTELLRQILADIRRDDLRASEIISHLRSLLGKRTTQPRPVDTTAVGEAALRLAAHEAARRDVVLESRFGNALPPVLGDPVQLEQVLLNLLVNGMQAMADTPIAQRRLQLRIEADGGRLLLTVADCGEGFPPEHLDRLFTSFFTTRENGMGLGLAIARSIVEAHGGHIEAANRPGGGAEFRVTLPAATRLPCPETHHEPIRSHRSYC